MQKQIFATEAQDGRHPARIFATEAQAGHYIAQTVASVLREKPDAVLCLAAGHTSLPAFAAMAEMEVDFSQARILGLDEWLGVPADQEGSCAYFLQKNLFSRINARPENIVLFDSMAKDAATACAAIENQLKAWGGIDYLLLGMGMNGHLALNEPGDRFDRGPHEAPLSETTLAVAPKYFPEGMPPIKSGVTLGIQNLLAAGRIQLAVFGAHTAAAVQKLFSYEQPTEEFPATALDLAENAELVLDEAAAGQ